MAVVYEYSPGATKDRSVHCNSANDSQCFLEGFSLTELKQTRHISLRTALLIFTPSICSESLKLRESVHQVFLITEIYLESARNRFI